MKKKTKQSGKTWPGLKEKSRIARIATSAVKESQSARERMLNSDEYTDRLDAALTAAEGELRHLMPAFTPIDVAMYFNQHVSTHLCPELENIAAHGHRNDDPNDTPEGESLLTDQDIIDAVKKSSNLINAIKLYRTKTGRSLKESLDSVRPYWYEQEKERRKNAHPVPELTPGEWHVYESEDETHPGRYVTDADGVLIADCYADTHLPFGLPDKEQRQQNARLIAQAPALFKELQFCCEQLRECMEQNYGQIWSNANTVVTNAESTITKARKLAGER